MEKILFSTDLCNAIKAALNAAEATWKAGNILKDQDKSIFIIRL